MLFICYLNSFSSLFQVFRHLTVGGHVPGLHALPWAWQPGGDAAGDERRPPGATKLLPRSGLRPHVPVLASDSRREAKFQNNPRKARILYSGYYILLLLLLLLCLMWLSFFSFLSI